MNVIEIVEAVRFVLALARHHLPTPRMATICQPAPIAVGLNLDKST